MIKSINGYLIFFLILAGLTFTSCGTKEKVVYSTTPAVEKGYDALFTDILSESFDFNTFSARLNINLSSGMRSLSSKASISIVRDDALQVSVQPLFGVEMFRFYINQDSVVVLDRMNKRFVSEDISSLQEIYPVGFDFYAVQALLTNTLFVAGKKNVDSGDFREFSYVRSSDMNYYLSAKDRKSSIDYSFNVNGDDRITFTHLMQPTNKYSLQWSYNNFVVMDKGLFPHKMNVSVSLSDRRMNTELIFSDIVIDEPIRVSVNVPDNYMRISLPDMFNFLVPN